MTDGTPKSVAELFADVPYGPLDALGMGFTSAEIGANTFAVTVAGAAATPWSRLVAIAYARAAEIGLERGWNTFRVLDMRRASDCESLNTDAPQAPIFAGRPRLIVTVLYGADASAPDARDSTETLAEMRSRLEDMTATELEKQATVDWVFEYCASTGLQDPSQLDSAPER